MSNSIHPNRPRKQRQGAMMVLVLVCLVIVFVGAAFAIDVAYMHTTRAQLRTATDAAARAGTEALGRTQDLDLAREAAQNVARQNIVAGKPLELASSDIEFGTSERNGNGRFEFDTSTNAFDSVRVTGRRVDGSPSGPVPLFFAPLFGVTDFQPVMSSSAAATTREIALVLDVSGSMANDSGGITRLEALQNAVDIFLNEINDSSPNSQMSLSTYSTNSQQLVELTDNFAVIRNTVANLNANGFTAIGEGLLTGSDSLIEDANVRPFSQKTVVILTDGRHNRGESPDISVTTATNRGQTVHTITFSDGANQALMRAVADLGGGIHVHAVNNQELNDAFRDIARTIAVFLTQ